MSWNWKIATAAALVAAMALIFMGCKLGPQRAAYNALAGTEITVDHAMQLWGSYVAEFHPPAAQEQLVDDAYEKYQAAESEAIDATRLIIALTASGSDASAAQARALKASSAAAAALGDLINLLRNFNVKI